MTSPQRSPREQHDPSFPSPPRHAQSETEQELTRLKQKLRDQNSRLQPSLTPRRPDGSAPPTSGGMSGLNYTYKPYTRVSSRPMWEPFAMDKEVVEWSEKIEKSEERIRELAREAEHKHLSVRPNAMILPPEPPVFSAADSEVPALAAAAETFAESVMQQQQMEMFELPSPQLFISNGGGDPSASINHKRDKRQSLSLSPGDGNVYKRRTSSIKVSSGTMSILRQLENCVDLHIPAPGEVELNRVGDVLTEKSVLKRDLFESAFNRVDQLGVLSGAPYFRMVPRFNIAGVAQADSVGIRTAVNEIRRVYANGPILWVCLREEPIIYINGKSHVVRNLDAHNKAASIPNINGTRIHAIEEKLHTEILAEASLNDGNVCIHRETVNGTLDALWEAVEDACTVQEVMNRLNNAGKNVHFIRRPVTQNVGPQPADFQFLFDLCLEFPSAPIVFNCQTGRGRSSIMMLMASIVRFYQHCPKDVTADATLLSGSSSSKETSYRSLMKLIALLPEGALHERRVAVLMELSDKIYSIADHINASFKATENMTNARMRLVQYAYVLLFSCYCSCRLWERSTTVTFPQWIDSMKEVQVILNNLTTRFQQQEERITVPLVTDATNDEAAHVVKRRCGNILRANTILRAAPKEILDGPTTVIPGVLALRHVGPDAPYFTCGRATDAGRENLLYNIRLNFPQSKRIHWISVRAEPMVFINESGYSVAENAVDPMESSTHIGLERLEEIEEKLKRDVLAESAKYGGKILVHAIQQPDNVTALNLTVKNVRTPRAVMEDFATMHDVHYFHVPIPRGGTLIPEDFEPLLRHLHNHFDEDDAYIIADGDGDFRTTVVLNVLTMYAATRTRSLRSIQTEAQALAALRKGEAGKCLSKARSYEGIDGDEMTQNMNIELQVGSVVGQMLAAGSLIHTVKAFMDLGGKGRQWNLLHAIDYAKETAHNEQGDKKVRLTEHAIDFVEQYLVVFLCAIYMDDNEGYNDILPFSKWASELEEVQNVMLRLRERPAASLKYVESTNLMASTVTDRAVSRRKGDVLTANFAMKADHFPGCAKKGIRPAVCGAPNFRKVELVNVYGVAIPTIKGVHNLLSVLGASNEPLFTYPNEANDDEMHIAYPSLCVYDGDEQPVRPYRKGRVIWINLREEPLMYVGDKPYVFRDMAQPYVNVELTGIEGSKVEMLEVRLKRDILIEAQSYDGNFLVHDEGKPGELVGTWEPATDETVRTVREVYDDASQKAGCRVHFYRMPVTDEQSPELKDFDMIISTLLPEIVDAQKHPEDAVSFVFNCQMGRGRTTTGMVVCCLLIGSMFPEYFEKLNKRHPMLFKPTDSELAQGNYKCIQQLKAILPSGRRSKLRLDLVLEACSKMQNLRSAIETFVNTVNSPDAREDERGRAYHHGVHYLQRYFNLIAFTEYLSAELDIVKGSVRTTFEDWMNSRPELASIREAAELQ